MKKLIFIFSALCLLFCSCSAKPDETPVMSQEEFEKYSVEMTHSFDSRYFAVLGVQLIDGTEYATVNIFSDEGDLVYDFATLPVDDFFGIRWQDDGYDIFILGSDGKISTFTFDGGQWHPVTSE